MRERRWIESGLQIRQKQKGVSSVSKACRRNSIMYSNATETEARAVRPRVTASRMWQERERLGRE